jgi:hypothetical protein
MAKKDATAVEVNAGASSGEPARPAMNPVERWMRGRFAPVLVLVVLAPVVAEVIFGATPITEPAALLPELAVYGCGALLIRELARRRGLGWAWILALGVAYGIVEEGLALQSLFDPELFNAGALGGRALGVNWVWTEWTLGYHAVWSISIPILLAELLFPGRRTEPWLGRVGPWVAGFFYFAGVSTLATIFRFVVAPGFSAPNAAFAVAALLTIGIVVLALRWPAGPDTPEQYPGSSGPERDGASPWIVGLVAFVAAGAWFVPLLDLPDALRAGAGALAPMLLALAAAAAAYVLIRRWSGPQHRWTDSHRLALVLGALSVSMLYGFFYVTAGNPADRVGQALANAVALILLSLFARRVSARAGCHSDTTESSLKPGA